MNSTLARRIRQTSVCLACAGLAAHRLTFAADPAPAVPKTHTLYMGANISIEHHGKLYRVLDVDGDDLVITVDGKLTRVPMRSGPVSFKIEDILRLGRNEVPVSDLKTDRVYTPANDPTRAFHEQAVAASAAAAELSRASAQYNTALTGASASGSNASGAGAGYAKAAGEQSVQNAAGAMQAAALQTGDFNNAGHHAMRMQTELDKKLYDAIEISFGISSEHPIDRPYLIAIARIHEPEAKPGEFRNWIFAKSLDPVDTRQEKYHWRQGGLPPGYELDWLHLHVYVRGEEIPTSVSARRVQLTREEAFQYLLLEYLSSHKGTTTDAAPVIADAPADFKARLGRGEIASSCYVRVTKDGLSAGAFVDSGCTEKISDPTVDGMVKTLRFTPALKNGTPVDSVVPVDLRKLPF